MPVEYEKKNGIPINWQLSRQRVSPLVKTQVYLRRLEGKAFTREAKEAVIRGLREKQHNYTSFFVCRNPVEKFLSVYNYLMDARVRFEAKLKTKH